MTVHASQRNPVLVVTAGTVACAIPLHHVVETMRPLSIEPVSGTPGFVRGLSVIRGSPTPVVDLKALLKKGEKGAIYGRFVTVKVADRRVAIAVDDVLGLMDADSAELGELPPILRDVSADIIEAIGARDAQLLVVLHTARIVPDEVWITLAAAEARR